MKWGLIKHLAIAAALTLSANVAAQSTYPSGPVHLIAPFPPGGAIDIVARTISEPLAKALGQPVVVENRPGANGTIGVANVANSQPDGHNLVLSALGAITIIPHVRDVGYQPLQSLQPITQAVSLALVWVARSDLDVKDMEDVIKLAKSGEHLTVGTSGNGSPNHLAVEQLNHMAGLKLTHVPYKGEGPALTDLMGGQIDLVVTTLVAASAPLESGRIKAVGAAGAKPPVAMPNLRTVADSGVPGYSAEAWQGVFAPAGTPEPIVKQLNAEIVKILHSKEVNAFLLNRGTEPVGNSVEDFTRYITDEFNKYGELAKAINLQLN